LQRAQSVTRNSPLCEELYAGEVVGAPQRGCGQTHNEVSATTFLERGGQFLELTRRPVVVGSVRNPAANHLSQSCRFLWHEHLDPVGFRRPAEEGARYGSFPV